MPKHYYIVQIRVVPETLLRAEMSNQPLTYKDAGVDIDAGSNLVDRIKRT